MQLGRSPTIPELAKAAAVEEEEVLEALESGRAYSSLSLSQGGGGTTTTTSIRSSRSARRSTSTWSRRTARCSSRASARSTSASGAILHLRFFEGLTQSQIAQQIGISQMHVSRLIRRSLEKIREEIGGDVPIEDAAPRRRAARG